jgi:hypothetical protein
VRGFEVKLSDEKVRQIARLRLSFFAGDIADFDRAGDNAKLDITEKNRQ